MQFSSKDVLNPVVLNTLVNYPDPNIKKYASQIRHAINLAEKLNALSQTHDFSVHVLTVERNWMSSYPPNNKRIVFDYVKSAKGITEAQILNMFVSRLSDNSIAINPKLVCRY